MLKTRVISQMVLQRHAVQFCAASLMSFQTLWFGSAKTAERSCMWCMAKENPLQPMEPWSAKTARTAKGAASAASSRVHVFVLWS